MPFMIQELKNEAELKKFFEWSFISYRENQTGEADDFEKHQQEVKSFVESQSKKGIFFIKTTAGKEIGYIWVSTRSGGEIWDFEDHCAWIYDVRVSPEYQYKGFGRQLLTQAETWARKEGFDTIALHVFGKNIPAINLYKHMGYSPKNCYYQKRISTENQIQSHSINYSFRKMEIAQDKDNFLSLVYEKFRTRALTTKEVT